MTLVTLPSPIAWPGIASQFNAIPALGTVATLTSAGSHYVTYVFDAREDMTVSHIGFRAGTVAGSPTIEIRIETVDTSTALPTGTLWATNTNGTTGTVSSNTSVLQALTASASITKGQVFAVKLLLATGTSLIVQNTNQWAAFQSLNLPYLVNNTGTPTKGNIGNNTPNIAIGSSSTTFYQVTGALPVSSTTGNTFNNSVAGAKRGLRFTIPMNCRAVGLRFYQAISTGDYNAALYSDAGSELSSSSTAFTGVVNAATNNATTYAFFDNTVTLTAGTTYRIAIEPTTTTNVNVTTMTLPSASYRGASPFGTTGHYATFTTGGGWVDSATDQIPLMDLIIDQIDDGTGSGGGGVVGVIGG